MGSLDADVLQFLDSLDQYLILSESMSATLRQGWLDLASARHSMGTSRMTSAVLDLKPHPAASTLHVMLDLSGDNDTDEVEQTDDIALTLRHPFFTLSKLSSVDDRGCLTQLEAEENMLHKLDSSSLRHRPSTQISEDCQTEQSTIDEVSVSRDDQERKQRSKLLSVYGVLISPKLRGAQVSFETALDTIVQLANTRSKMIAAFERIRRETDGDLE